MHQRHTHTRLSTNITTHENQLSDREGNVCGMRQTQGEAKGTGSPIETKAKTSREDHRGDGDV